MEEDRTENVDTVAQNDKWKKMKQKKSEEILRFLKKRMRSLNLSHIMIS